MAYILRPAVEEKNILNHTFQRENEKLQVKGMSIDNFFSRGLPIPKELEVALPNKLIVKPNPGNFIPDFSRCWFSCWLVSERFVNIVQRLEPDVNEFWPIPECVDSNGQELPKKFFLMNVVKHIQAIDIEKSNAEYVEDIFYATVHGERKKFSTYLLKWKNPHNLRQTPVLKKELIEGHHLWRGTQSYFGDNHYISEHLYEEIKKESLSDLQYDKCEEI